MSRVARAARAFGIVSSITFGVASVARIASVIPTSKPGFRSGVLFEALQTKLGAAAFGIAPTPFEVLEFERAASHVTKANNRYAKLFIYEPR